MAGLAVGCWQSGDRLLRMVALTAVVTAVAFVFTPEPLAPFGNGPYNFVYNLRFSFFALITGLVLLPILVPGKKTRVRNWLLVVLTGIVGVTQLDSTIWPTSLFSQQFAPPADVSDSLIGIGIGIVAFVVISVLLTGRPPWLDRAVATGLAVGGAITVIVLASVVQQIYLRDRYQDTPPMAPLYTWAQGVQNARIALTGPFSNDSYPLYGRDDSNYVQVIGKIGPGGSFTPITNCPEFDAL